MKQVHELQASVLELEEENASVRKLSGATKEGAEKMQ